MDLDLHGLQFKKHQINKKRIFYYTIYHQAFSQSLKRHKIIFHAYFLDRLKIYDIPILLNQQISTIEEFLNNNKDYNRDNTIFYLLAESPKGLSFTPDIELLKFITKSKFANERSKGILFGQAVAVFPPKFLRVLNMLSKNYFGFERGEAYDFSSTYEDALKCIESFDNIITPDDVSDFFKNEIE